MYLAIVPFEDVLTGRSGTLARYLILAFIALAAVDLLRDGSDLRASGALSAPAIGMLVVLWVSVVWSGDLVETMERNQAYSAMLLLYLMVCWTQWSERERAMLKGAIVLGGAAAAGFLLGFRRDLVFSDYGRAIISEESDPNNLAARFILPLFVALLVAGETRGLRRSFAFVSAAGALLIMLLTGSRGGVVALLLAAIVLVLVGVLTGRTARSVGAVVAAFLLGVTALKFVPAETSSRFLGTDSYLRDLDGVGTRSGIWRTLWYEVFPGLPAWGVGSGRAPALLADYYGYPKAVHNTYLNMLVEYGLLGLPLLLILLYVIGSRLVRAGALLDLALLVATATSAFFLDSFAKKFFWATLIYLVAVAPVRDGPARPDEGGLVGTTAKGEGGL